uniref:C2H2-type domain-containing protein n=1 Tax=Biomphalaria glabrata TaxID=6526 RepID=A0A2C9K501_BIOGL
MDQWESPSNTHVSPEFQFKASLSRVSSQGVSSPLSSDSRTAKLPVMETLAEPSLAANHCHFNSNSYYPKADPSQYYMKGNSSLSPQPYSYLGYKGGSDGEARPGVQTGGIPSLQYRYAKETDDVGPKLHSNQFSPYYQKPFHPMSPSFMPQYKGNYPNKGNYPKESSVEVNLTENVKQQPNDNDSSHKDTSDSLHSGHGNIREQSSPYSRARDVPFTDRPHKYMPTKQMLKPHQNAEDVYQDPYINWRSHNVNAGDSYNFQKDKMFYSSEHQKDMATIKTEENMMQGRFKTRGSLSEPNQMVNSQSPIDNALVKQDKGNSDSLEHKVDEGYSVSSFDSRNQEMLSKVKENSMHPAFNQDPNQETLAKNDIYRSTLFFRNNSLGQDAEGRERMSQIAYGRDGKSHQWNEPSSLYSSQEFLNGLHSPNKFRPNYPYSSTPGKNVFPDGEEAKGRPEWKNMSSQMLNTLQKDHSDTTEGKVVFGDSLPLKTSVSTLPLDCKDRSPSPIKSVFTPNLKKTYDSMVSPLSGNSNTFCRKFPSEQESLDDPKKQASQNDDSMMSKKEVQSDDGCDDSPYPGMRPEPSLSPPSPDSSMTYPPQFPHPYFASPIRGSSSVQRLQFGSPRGQHELGQMSGPSFPFDKDFTGRFQLPGLGQEMLMGGSYMGPLPPNIVQGVGDDKDIFFCHLCSYSGKSKLEFDSHMNIHFEFNCPHCDYTSRTEGRLKRHIKDFHSDDSSRRALPGRPKIYKCKQCPFSTREKDKFWEHARTHIKEDKLLQCPKCSFVTEYKHHLEYHLRNHFNSKPYKCNKCNYSCVNKSMLNSHMKSHTNVYQYRCSNCTYATKYCHSLKLHLRKYNHKPATVLNQDGSIPQGLDVESSGISVVAKRGPPRGPRGPRKDKQDPYVSQMFGLPQGPMGMSPMMNGMIPFWPMLPHVANHLSPHAGMLPSMGDFAHQMKMRAKSDSLRRTTDGDKMDATDSDEESGQLRDDEYACRLCDFVGENTEALCIHFVDVHKDEAKEVARACGVSEENLAASLSRLIPELMAGGRRLSEPLTESDSEPSDYIPVQSTTDMTPRSPEPTESKTSECKTSQSTWSASQTEQAVNYSPMRSSSNEERNDVREIDILQQMTLKFGDGNMFSQRQTFPPEEQRQQKETPLDLTKPKSVSPEVTSSPPSPQRTDSLQTPERFSQNDYPIRKRMLRETFEETQAKELSPLIPRKRSRKGKAYKLDTLCMKLQERQVNTADSDGSQSDMDTMVDDVQPPTAFAEEKIDNQEQESNSKNDQIKEANASSFKAQESCPAINYTQSEDEDTDEYEVNEEEGQCEKQKISPNNERKLTVSENDFDCKKFETSSSTEVDSEFEKLQRSLAILNNGIDPDNDCKSLLFDRTATSCDETTMKNHSTERCNTSLTNESSAVDSVNKSHDSMPTFEGDETSSIREFTEKNIQDENKSFENSSSVSEVNLIPSSDKDVREICKSSDDSLPIHFASKSAPGAPTNDAALCYDEIVFSTPKMLYMNVDAGTDKNNEPLKAKPEEQKGVEGNESIPGTAETEAVDPVEMINTVIENRKKPVPPAVRRGTEVAWKLLHDPVNPVTSLPLPIDSPPLPQNQVVAPTVTSTPAVVPSSSALVRSHMTMKPPMHFSPRMYSNQRPAIHPLNTHIHMPLPPTPMAFIPPTSHMMPEPPPMIRPLAPPPMKMAKPEEYSCTFCGLSFQDCVMYTVHMGYHSNKNPFKCNSCGIVCRDKVDFFLHIARSPHA